MCSLVCVPSSIPQLVASLGSSFARKMGTISPFLVSSFCLLRFLGTHQAGNCLLQHFHAFNFPGSVLGSSAWLSFILLLMRERRSSSSGALPPAFCASCWLFVSSILAFLAWPSAGLIYSSVSYFASFIACSYLPESRRALIFSLPHWRFQ